MPGCVLRVSGRDFDVDVFLPKSSLEPCHIYRRGEVRRKTEVRSDSGLHLDLSDAGSLAEEAVEVVRYLLAHLDELRRLQIFPGVTDLCLDFGYYRRDVVVQCDRLPAELIKLAGSLGMSIELSLYPSPSAEVDAPVLPI